jgi:NitT/TauT family transport system ATP-binding protein
MVGEPIISLKGVSKVFEGPRGEKIEAVAPLDLRIENNDSGDFVAVLGPSGCGKSTVLNMISGLIAPTAGELQVLGHSAGHSNGQTVTVPQKYTCFPWLTVLQNVRFGLELQGLPAKSCDEVALRYLEKVGLAARTGAYPRELSGGMQQRVAIARAMAVSPKILLMDEPFGALDSQTRGEMQQMLLDLWESEKSTILFITHDISEALFLANRILVFSSRPARILKDFTVSYPRPRSRELFYDPDFIQSARALAELLRT